MRNIEIQENELRMSARVKLPKEWLVDYQPARERAIRWLGERYLLARDVPRVTARPAAAAQSLARGGGVETVRLPRP